MKLELSRGLRHFEVDIKLFLTYFFYCALLTIGVSLLNEDIKQVQTSILSQLVAKDKNAYSFTFNVGTILFCLGMIGVSIKVTENKPLSYFLRILSFFIGVPAIFSFIDASSLAVTNQGHLLDICESSITFATITPFFLFLTTGILPGSLVRKMSWVALASAFMIGSAIVFPYLHTYAINHLASYYIPVLNVFFAKLLLSFELVCFYGLVASQK